MNNGVSLEQKQIAVLTTGGTIDKVYFDAKSRFEVGDSVVDELLKEAHVEMPYRIVEVMRKDSLEIDDLDRQLLCDSAASCGEDALVVTHGTDTLALSATTLMADARLLEKTIVLTGALSPARFAKSDATFNVGMAFAASQSLAKGVYIVMNGQVFAAGSVKKDTTNNKFVRC